MDPLWKRNEAVSICLGNKITKNRIIVEGKWDRVILGYMPDSGNFKIDYINQDYYGFKDNKKSVIKVVSQSLISGKTPPTIGLVDMDADLDKVYLNTKMEHFCKNIDIDSSQLKDFVKDSRMNSCLFSLISSQLDGSWIWLKKLKEELNLSNNWVEDIGWKLVLRIAKFRTGIHMLCQSRKQCPEFLDKSALSAAGKHSPGYTFENWLDLFIQYKDKIECKYVNDHCLEATISDWMIDDCNGIQEIVKLKQQIENSLRKILKNEITSNQYHIDDLLNHVGNPFKKTT
jgi:hypothetical protein